MLGEGTDSPKDGQNIVVYPTGNKLVTKPLGAIQPKTQDLFDLVPHDVGIVRGFLFLFVARWIGQGSYRRFLPASFLDEDGWATEAGACFKPV